MKILITGAAGFIGFHLANKLLISKKNSLTLIDSFENNYSVKLKKLRLKELKRIAIREKKKFFFKNLDISDKKKLDILFKKNKFDIVINLAAIAGVRYSVKYPYRYIRGNLVGFANIIELSRIYKIRKFIYASTSSVYGKSNRKEFIETQCCEAPEQIYSATKKSNELLAFSYSRIFKLQTIGLRFFTVYGPWGRPDMAIFKFVKNISENREIELYNFGNHKRSFTYIDDVIESINRLIFKKNNKNKSYRIFNIGGFQQTKITKLVKIITSILNKKFKKIGYSKLQAGDVINTKANCQALFNYIKFKPKIRLEYGILEFVKWYNKNRRKI